MSPANRYAVSSLYMLSLMIARACSTFPDGVRMLHRCLKGQAIEPSTPYSRARSIHASLHRP